MLAKPVTGWENRFPGTIHYHNCCRKAITNLYKFRPQIYQKSTGWERKTLPARRELSTVPLPFFMPFFQRLFALFAFKKRLHLGKQCAGKAFHR